MPKHFRKCNFCPQNSITHPDIVIFLANNDLKQDMNISTDGLFYICESHFQASDLKPHGTTKRLRDGAVPLTLPNQEAVRLDHDYVLTTQLDMVKYFLKRKIINIRSLKH